MTEKEPLDTAWNRSQPVINTLTEKMLEPIIPLLDVDDINALPSIFCSITDVIFWLLVPLPIYKQEEITKMIINYLKKTVLAEGK